MPLPDLPVCFWLLLRLIGVNEGDRQHAFRGHLIDDVCHVVQVLACTGNAGGGQRDARNIRVVRAVVFVFLHPVAECNDVFAHDVVPLMLQFTTRAHHQPPHHGFDLLPAG